MLSPGAAGGDLLGAVRRRAVAGRRNFHRDRETREMVRPPTTPRTTTSFWHFAFRNVDGVGHVEAEAWSCCQTSSTAGLLAILHTCSGRGSVSANGVLTRVPPAAQFGQFLTLHWLQDHDCPWDDTCMLAAKKGSLMCCGGRGSTNARGMRIRVAPLLRAGTFTC